MRCYRTVLLLISIFAVTSVARVESVERIGFTVSDMNRSIDFYTKVLDFRVISDVQTSGDSVELLTGVFGANCRVVRLKLGMEEVELTQYIASQGRTYPSDSRSHDQWFQHIAIITSNMEQAYHRLRLFGVQHASTKPQKLPEWNKNAAGIEAFYFRDPDGHVLEVLAFPDDKGLPEWHTRKGLFLGIDHSAIVVADTERSISFYRDALGLAVVGTSENFGPEQEHLNNVPGAHLQITTLRGPTGPAVELLEYISPTDGRPYPADEKPNDIVHWQITTRVDDLAADAEKSVKKSGKIISEKSVENQQLLRDPDGHVLLLQQKQ